jgi:hypothetical protein
VSLGVAPGELVAILGPSVALVFSTALAATVKTMQPCQRRVRT